MWDQVNAWRLAQHGLAPRVGFMEAVLRMIGVQAQVMSAAELALGRASIGCARPTCRPRCGRSARS